MRLTALLRAQREVEDGRGLLELEDGRFFREYAASPRQPSPARRAAGMIVRGDLMMNDATPKSFYRRPLPSAQIPFSSAEGRALFREALASGDLEGYFAIAEQFHTQAEPAFCGLGSLVMALNALAIDPGRLWKGPWRWFGEEMLDCCAPLDEVRTRGLTLDELACLARCNGAKVAVHRPDEADVGRLRAAIAAASAGGSVVIAAYARDALGQSGGGHFSPVAGIHRARDLTLLLDVARFKYPPHWVPVAALWEAMRPADPETGRPRGFLVLEAATGARPLLFRLQLKKPWREVLTRLRAALEAETRAASSADIVAGILGALAALGDVIEVGETAPTDDAHQRLADGLLHALRQTALYRRVGVALDASPSPRLPPALRAGALAKERATLLLFVLLSGDMLDSLSLAAREEAAALTRNEGLPPSLDAEVGALRTQLAALCAIGGGRSSCSA